MIILNAILLHVGNMGALATILNLLIILVKTLIYFNSILNDHVIYRTLKKTTKMSFSFISQNIGLLLHEIVMYMYILVILHNLISFLFIYDLYMYVLIYYK